jgi:phosphoenolpyruvate-protein kinase (PTS system EI component)
MSDLVQLAQRHSGAIHRTHWDGCERDHPECLIQRMADELERLRAWRDTVDDMLTVCHEIAGDDPRKSINRLINWHVSVALDPAVSSDAAQLVAAERARCAQIVKDTVRAVDGADALAAIREG